MKCAIVFISALCCAAIGSAQEQRVPSFQNTTEIPFLQEAEATSNRAKAMENQHSYLSAVQEYEAEISRAEQSPILFSSYPVSLILAQAHLDAARVRIKYADTLKDLGLHEQNQKLITQHLAQIPGLVVNAVHRAGPDAKLQTFKCRAYELVGHGSFLQGMVNQSAHDIEIAIQGYEHTLSCDPKTVPQIEKIIGYLKSVDRQMSGSILSKDMVEKIVSKVVELSFGEGGTFLSAGIDIAYDYLKAHTKPPLE